MIYGWDNPYNMIRDEIAQLEFEGYIIPMEIKLQFESLDKDRQSHDEEILQPIFDQLQEYRSFSRKDNWNFHELNGLDEIRAARPQGPRKMDIPYDEGEMLHRLHGAWTGRASGCALGKPVEIIGFSENGRGIIKDHLQRRNAWPLKDYIPGTPMEGDKQPLICEKSWKENIRFMEPDDDIHYTLIGLKVLEEFGGDFTWRDVANTWNSSLPYQAICTAENQAILNYNMKTHFLERHLAPISPDFTSRYNNPYREWIGAQIRADGWAYCCAGNPQLAAEFAWRDSHWTHRQNGIYGEMFMAAIIAAAFVEMDPLKLIEIGLSEIPENCQLAHYVRMAVKQLAIHDDWESFMQWLEEELAGMSPVHTINNALVCIMSIYYGKMNPDESISIAVMAALDTDCNGATVGSITGAAHGRKGFGPVYAPQLNDQIKPQVFGFQDITMTELSQRTMDVWEKLSQSK